MNYQQITIAELLGIVTNIMYSYAWVTVQSVLQVAIYIIFVLVV